VAHQETHNLELILGGHLGRTLHQRDNVPHCHGLSLEQQLLAGLSGVLRGSDWLEVAGEQVWILLDQPEQGAASSLTQRLSEALPGLRGAGTIRVSTGIQARECMDRVTQLMRTNDQLHIEEESC
jgi:hypothetical protein